MKKKEYQIGGSARTLAWAKDEITPIVLIAAETDPLVQRKSLKLRDLHEQRFILREKGSGTRMVADTFLKQHKFKVDIRMELGSNEAIKEAVAGGLGIGIISQHALHGHRKENGVSILPVKGFPIVSHWHIVHHAKKQLPPVAQGFKQHLLKSTSGHPRYHHRPPRPKKRPTSVSPKTQ